jgi:hypothetical protein
VCWGCRQQQGRCETLVTAAHAHACVTRHSSSRRPPPTHLLPRDVVHEQHCVRAVQVVCRHLQAADLAAHVPHLGGASVVCCVSLAHVVTSVGSRPLLLGMATSRRRCKRDHEHAAPGAVCRPSHHDTAPLLCTRTHAGRHLQRDAGAIRGQL